MKAILTWALASIGLAFTPVAAQTAAAGDVDYSEAMACSSLYTVLAAAAEGEPEYEEFVDVSARWLIIATDRDGRDEVIGEDELQVWVTSLLGELEAQADDASREAFLYEGIDVCEASYHLIAEEFDSIEIE
jgi:hypothetical protein